MITKAGCDTGPFSAVVVIPAKVSEILIPWLESHEKDIIDGVGDFGDLKPVYDFFFTPQPWGGK